MKKNFNSLKNNNNTKNIDKNNPKNTKNNINSKNSNNNSSIKEMKCTTLTKKVITTPKRQKTYSNFIVVKPMKMKTPMIQIMYMN